MDGPEVILRSRVTKLVVLSQSQDLSRGFKCRRKRIVVNGISWRATDIRIEGQVAERDGMQMAKLAVL